MKVKQLSIFLENKSGGLAEALGVIADKNINIRALSLADTSGYGILRLIVNDIDSARNALTEAEFTVRETDVIAVSIPDMPGGLAHVLSTLAKRAINIEYMYAFVQKSYDNAVVIFRIEDLDGAIDILESCDIKVLPAEEVYSL